MDKEELKKVILGIAFTIKAAEIYKELLKASQTEGENQNYEQVQPLP